MQVIRLVGGLGALFDGGPTPAREVPASLAWLLLDPLAWFPGALGTAVPTPWGAWPRAVGWLACLAGVALAWRGRREAPEPDTMLLRLLSLAVPLQVLSLWLANRDLHHLAQAAPGLALLAGLAAARVASALIPGAGWRARAFGFALVLPLLAAGVGAQVRVPGLLAGAEARTVTADGQAALLTLVRRAGVTDLWTSDYDLYGVFEVLAPDLRVAHAWGACSASRDRPGLTADLLRAARGGHWLVVRPSAARIYDLAPDDAAVQRAAVQAGVRAEVVGSLADGRGTWARLYAVRDP
jgi:hypothetical protein